MPSFVSTSSSPELISGRKFLIGGVAVVVLILGILLTVYLITSSESESFVLDRTPLFAGRNNLAQNLKIVVNDNLTSVDLNSNLANDTKFGRINCPHCNTDFVRLRKGQVGSQFWVAQAGCDNDRGISNVITQLDVINRMIKDYSEYLQLVRTMNDLEDAYENKKLGSLIFVDGGPMINGSTAVFRLFHDLGVRAITIGSGCNSTDIPNFVEKKGALTDFGKICLEEMNRLGLMIDIQGLSSPVQQQILNMSRAPVMISHTAASSLRNHVENVDNDTLKALKANNGLLMLTFDGPYLADDNVTLSSVVEHLNTITSSIGFDNIAIGGNYDSDYDKPEGLEDVSDFPKLFKELKADKSKVWTTENQEKLAYLNFKRFFSDVEKAKVQ